MSLAQIRDDYHVPTRYGAPVRVDALDIEGTITGSLHHHRTDYVEVTAPDGFVINIHPTDLTYLPATRISTEEN